METQQDLSTVTSSETIEYWQKIQGRCPGFHDGLQDYCSGDEPDAGERYCNSCKASAKRVRIAAEDNKERREEEGSWTQEARLEYLRVLNLCDRVLKASSVVRCHTCGEKPAHVNHGMKGRPADVPVHLFQHAPVGNRLTIAEMRGAILDVIDGQTWLLYEQISHLGFRGWTEDQANAERLDFADAVIARALKLAEMKEMDDESNARR